VKLMIIPEDFRKDQYILKPIFKRLVADLGKPRTFIEICQDPLMGGVEMAMKEEQLRAVFERHPMFDLFILCVDRDGKENRRQRLNDLERIFASTPRLFIAEHAWEELETWLLAGLTLPKDWSWQAIRRDISVKEQYFTPLAQERGFATAPGEGRKPLGEEAARNIAAIRAKCPEDFDALAQRLASLLTPS